MKLLTLLLSAIIVNGSLIPDANVRTHLEAICKAAEKAQVGLGRAIRVAIEAGNALGAAVTVAVDKATKMAAQTTEAATKMATQATDAAKATFESGTKALGDAAGSAVDAIKGFVPGFGK